MEQPFRLLVVERRPFLALELPEFGFDLGGVAHGTFGMHRSGISMKHPGAGLIVL
jgi:hypothetical protein